MSRKDQRRAEKAALFEEGREAALAGRGRGANPYRSISMDRGHWFDGHDAGVRELEQPEQGDEHVPD
jgi:ribosome modulation factor